eukprot:661445-Rhodomonas_salina.1
MPLKEGGCFHVHSTRGAQANVVASRQRNTTQTNRRTHVTATAILVLLSVFQGTALTSVSLWTAAEDKGGQQKWIAHNHNLRH